MAKMNNKQAFIKERNRILNSVRIGEKQGKKYDTSLIPNLPNKVTAKKLQEIRKIKPKSIRVGSEFIDITERTATSEELVTKKVEKYDDIIASKGNTSSYLEKPITLPPSDDEIIERITNRLYNTISDKYTIDIDDVSDYVYKIYEQGGLEMVISLQPHNLYEFAFTKEGISAKEHLRRIRTRNLELTRKAKDLKRPPKEEEKVSYAGQGIHILSYGIVDKIIDKVNTIPDNRYMKVYHYRASSTRIHRSSTVRALNTGDFRDHILSNIYNRLEVYGEQRYNQMLMEHEEEIMGYVGTIIYDSDEDKVREAYTTILTLVLGRELTTEEYEHLDELNIYENDDDFEE